MSTAYESLREIEHSREHSTRHYEPSAFGPQVGKTFPQRPYVRTRVNRCVEGPFARSGPVDDIRRQFRNCVSVEFAVGASDRKTRSSDTRSAELGSVCVKLTQQLQVTVTFDGIIMRRNKYFGMKASPSSHSRSNN